MTALGGLDVPAWTDRIGGPLGKHARVSRSLWYNPAPWVTIAMVVTWVILMLRQLPCIPTMDRPYSRLCYSDIPTLFVNKMNLSLGSVVYYNNAGTDGAWQFEYPVLVGGVVWLARWLAGLTGAAIHPFATLGERVDAAVPFWAFSALLLFACFAVLVWAHLEMGRNSASRHTDGVQTRAWDAMFVAAAPVVMLSGLINWDLLAVALTSVALLLWARRHPALAGVVIGLAVSVKFYPLALVVVFLVLCLRASRMKAWTAFMAGGMASWVAVNLPVMIKAPQAWAIYWTYNATRGPDYGSLWYILTLAGAPLSDALVTMLSALALAACGGIIVGLTLSAPRRPRVGQVALLVLVAFLVFNKVYSPQYVLWLLPVVVLARPVLHDLAAFTISESLYYFAIWGYLGGALARNSGPDHLYWLAVALRIGVQLWLAYRVLDDMRHPWSDPVRGPFIDDPIGGVLKHAPDATWMLAAPPRPLEDAPEPWEEIAEKVSSSGSTARDKGFGPEVDLKHHGT